MSKIGSKLMYGNFVYATCLETGINIYSKLM